MDMAVLDEKFKSMIGEQLDIRDKRQTHPAGKGIENETCRTDRQAKNTQSKVCHAQRRG
jgi:hypothetical protein